MLVRSEQTTNAKPETCCGCITIRAGVITIGIISLILAVCGIAEAISGLTKSTWSSSTTTVNNGITNLNTTNEFNLGNGFPIAYLISSLIFAAVSILLIFGTCIKVVWLLWPYIIYSIIEVIACIALMVFCIVALIGNAKAIGQLKDADRSYVYTYVILCLVVLFISTLLIAYFTWVVYRSRKVLISR
ncbi:hypothetical protein M3Y94_00613400 [Aphelenchoides besseyi]|nr:hypothetical protein M3Y94_00613400 [Aphelenchoides besseyi]